MTPAALGAVLLTLAPAADGRTVGEREFLKLLGRDCPVVRLWPGGRGPDEPKPMGPEEVRYHDPMRGRTNLLRIVNVSDPSMIVIGPQREKNTGVALVLAPGGGYGGLASESHVATAKVLNDLGVTLVYLKYRVPKRHDGYPINHQPLQDAQRAMGILRSRAKEWGIDPARIGFGGVSAGGHLAASIAINHAERWYKPVDAFDGVSCRPDFSVLFKPAYLTDPIVSRERDKQLHYERISSKDTPPTLIAINRPDKFTTGAVEYYQALMDAGVPAELHVYPEGGHGEPLETYPFGEWVTEWRRFLGDRGLWPGVKPPAKPAPVALKLEPAAPADGLTVGDAALRTFLGRECPVVPVWPAGPGPDETGGTPAEEVLVNPRRPDVLSVRNVTRPTLTVVKPPKDKDTGRAVVVCPGGGYGSLAALHEGTQVCEWLNSLGITGFLLKYRVPKRGGEFPKHHHALQDLQRSVRLVRANAAGWGIDPKRVGVLGFSAGGHLCAALCTNWDKDHYPPRDAADKASARPDFAVLTYPAYLTEPRSSNEVDPLFAGLKRNVTPPMFLSVARDDSFARGALNFFLKAHEGKLPAELHVYAGGGHGGGISPASYPASHWVKDCERWLKDLETERK